MKIKILNSFLAIALFAFPLATRVSATTVNTIGETSGQCSGNFVYDTNYFKCREYEVTADWSGDLGSLYINTDPNGSVDANGNIYIIRSYDINGNDLADPELVKINATDGTKTVLHTYDAGFPYYAVIGNDGHVYTANHCTDTDQECFLKYNTSNGNISMVKLDSYYSEIVPWGFVVDSSGNIYFESFANSNAELILSKVDPAGTETVLRTDVEQDTEFYGIIFIDSTDTIYVSSSKNNPNLGMNMGYAVHTLDKTTGDASAAVLTPNPVYVPTTFLGYEFYSVSDSEIGYAQWFSDDKYFVHNTNTDTLNEYDFETAWGFTTPRANQSIKSEDGIIWITPDSQTIARMDKRGDTQLLTDQDFYFNNNVQTFSTIIEGTNDNYYVYTVANDIDLGVTTAKFYKINFLQVPGTSFTHDYIENKSYPVTINFTDTSTTAPTSWSWDFDSVQGEDLDVDSTLQNPTHVFNQSGIYTVTLSTDGPAGPDLHYTDIYVYDQAPVANFNYAFTSTNQVAPAEVQFTDTSTNNPVGWQWDFDNNGTVDSAQQNPKYTYTSAGTYSVKLTASNAGGSGTITKNAIITINGGWGSWSNTAMTSSSKPTLKVFGSKLFQAVSGKNGLEYTRIHNGVAWSAWQTSGASSIGGVEMEVLGSKLFQSVSANNGLEYTRIHNGTSWGPWVKSGASSMGGVEMEALGTKLFQSVSASNGLEYTRIYEAGTWGAWTKSGASSTARVGMKAFGTKLFQSVSASNGLEYTRIYQNGVWSAWVKSGASSVGGIEMEVKYTKLFQSVSGSNNLEYTRIYENGVWGPWVKSGASSIARIEMKTYGTKLFQSVSASNGFEYTRIHENGVWGPWVKGTMISVGGVEMEVFNGKIYQSITDGAKAVQLRSGTF